VTRGARFPSAVLVIAAALAVHELRYLAGHDASAAPAGEGHGYLSVAVPVVLLVLAGVGFAFAAMLVRARHAPLPARGPRPSVVRTSLVAAALVALVYAGQEAAEGALSAGHPVGLAAVLGNGGWLAVPLALVAGVVVALVLRGAQRALAAASRGSRTDRRAISVQPARPPRVDLPRLAALAAGRAGRAPPLVR
jgi:hypothetical protein